jgi:hypothetical protein
MWIALGVVAVLLTIWFTASIDREEERSSVWFEAEEAKYNRHKSLSDEDSYISFGQWIDAKKISFDFTTFETFLRRIEDHIKDYPDFAIKHTYDREGNAVIETRPSFKGPSFRTHYVDEEYKQRQRENEWDRHFRDSGYSHYQTSNRSKIPIKVLYVETENGSIGRWGKSPPHGIIVNTPLIVCGDMTKLEEDLMKVMLHV